MTTLSYGVWNGVVYDNRRQSVAKSPPSLKLDVFSEFDSENPIDIIFSHHGFLVFNPAISLVSALEKHHKRLAEESCGKCSPCRSGSQLLLRWIDDFIAGRKVDWNLIIQVADLMEETSLCGLGRTGVVPLRMALKYFFTDVCNAKHAWNFGGFFTSVTSACIEACPVHSHVPRCTDYIKDGHEQKSAQIILDKYPLIGTCGRVCVKFCEKACRRQNIDSAVNLRDLQRFAGDMTEGCEEAIPQKEPPKEKRIAIVGAGPAGLACAHHLLRRGYDVEIFEAKPLSGGMVRYGIPSYRLPKNVVDFETSLITSMGGRINYNRRLGRDFHINDLFDKGYSAVFLGMGCPFGTLLGMDGDENAPKEYRNGIEFLENVYTTLEKGEQPILEGDVVVVGGGNVAMDCCRSARRMTKGNVHLVYRRTREDAPADQLEITDAIDEGVIFHFLTGQNRLVIENGKIKGLQCVQMEQTETDETGRRGVRRIDGSEFVIPCDHVIAAIGQNCDPSSIVHEDGIVCDKKHRIVVDRFQFTSRLGVFAGGDGTAGPRTQGATVLIEAMGQGEVAAEAIDMYLSTGKKPFVPHERMSDIIKEANLFKGDVAYCEQESPRTKHPMAPADIRRTNFEEVEYCISREDAWKESHRCLRCYRLISVATTNPIPGLPGVTAE